MDTLDSILTLQNQVEGGNLQIFSLLGFEGKAIETVHCTVYSVF